ncbi:MAG: inositol monophosphatase [bacterium]|nr:inositol monophosphatase [bacterium]
MKEIIKLIRELKPVLMNRDLSSSVTEKGRADFVTAVDTSVQAKLSEELLRLYPDTGFMGEEGEHKAVDLSGKIWILDPVDGTTNLIHDYRMSAVSLGLLDGGEPVMGIIYNPFTEELFCAEKGRGAYLNNDIINVSSEAHIRNALIAFGTSPYDRQLADVNFRMIKEAYLRSGDIRRSGSAALDLAYTACGRIDGFFERNLKSWDYCAGICIVNEAGGKVTNMHGGAVTFDKNSDILASNGKIHDNIIEITAY